jgi:hypothetical protein
MEKKEKKNLLQEDLKIINIGLEIFHDELKNQAIEVLQVEWVPPAEGDREVANILEKLL